MEKVVLAYSGGLDTSFCAVYLSKIKQLEVHAVMVNLGGFSEEEIKKTEERAYQLGVKSFHVIDDAENYYEKCIKYLIFGNVLKNNTYPLSVSSERVFQATAIADYAKKIGAKAIAHGSTGAGNDQVRFDSIFQILLPEIEIITPIRDLKLSRNEEIDFLKENGFKINFEKSQYSINKGLWGTSVGGKETLTSNLSLPETAYPTQISKTEPEEMSITFEKGEIKAVNGEGFSKPIQAIQKIQAIAQAFGIGRDTHVGDTIIGIKGRVSFEAAAPLIILKAHHLLEKHTLTKNQLLIKDQLSLSYGNYLHDGLVLDPVMKDIEMLFENAQKTVNGTVKILLKPYHFNLIGIESPNDLMSSDFGSYGEMNKTWTESDVKGFSKIYSNALSIYHQVNNKN
ncbi:argininosuccinate synthase [Chryseobacterium sp. HSC-36S06]|uniref:argininosuccinate synthase n=1 Tax=Chryseobacterium sp. HSC-36S06 TaxID=2910970 RepID=UPI0020A1DFC3|nr:argininosuccinate synthase [Chryseobacterium sp. HSC-36S06]MCP2038144.1 argininosuccinate synthase [Chryseobacterium sp. HSC-36S06]